MGLKARKIAAASVEEFRAALEHVATKDDLAATQNALRVEMRKFATKDDLAVGNTDPYQSCSSVLSTKRGFLGRM